jgi:predicted MFS family arabinose efflux permease
MDHTGAIAGPLIATAFLFFWPGQYRTLFALTIIPGALAVWMLFKVPEHDRSYAQNLANHRTHEPRTYEPSNPRTNEPSNPRTNEPSNPRTHEPTRLPVRFWFLLVVILIFSLGNSADAFLLLRLSTAIGTDAWLPLLWAALHVVKASLSTYGGGLSDRVGRKAVIIAGWGVYAAVYIGFALVDSPAALVACFLTYGIYFGLAEGSEKALVADFAPAARRGTAFGWYNAALGVGTLLASVVFGVLYEEFGHATAFTIGAGLAAGAAVLLLLIPADK